MGLRDVARFATATRGIAQAGRNLQAVRSAREKQKQDKELFDLNKKQAELKLKQLELEDEMAPVQVDFLRNINKHMFGVKEDEFKAKETLINMEDFKQRQIGEKSTSMLNESLASPDVQGLISGGGINRQPNGVAGRVNPRLPQQSPFDVSLGINTPVGKVNIKPRSVSEDERFRNDLQSFKRGEISQDQLQIEHPEKDLVPILSRLGVSSQQTTQSEQINTPINQDSKEIEKDESLTIENKEPQPGDIVPSGFDEFGRPKGFERVKRTAAQEKRDVEIKELDAGIKNIVDSYNLARRDTEEAGLVLESSLGKRGVMGRLAGKEAVVRGKLGHLPSVNVFQDRIKAFATTVAKAAGEVRPTDMDIERFIGTLPTIEKNDEENELIIRGLVNDLESRGAKAVWAERSNSEPKETKVPKGKIRVINPNGEVGFIPEEQLEEALKEGFTRE